MLSFSCDAVSVIPHTLTEYKTKGPGLLYPPVCRFSENIWYRFTAQEMIDIHGNQWSDILILHTILDSSSSIILNDDEVHKIQYIAGFILQKMQKRC